MVEPVMAAAVIISLQRLIELAIARSNRAWVMAAGVQEFGAGHYPLFFILHAGWIMGWVGETYLRQTTLSQVWPYWLALFAAAQVLRYWCITSLGRCWNTRILVVPGQKLIKRGPYRYICHPNYMAVAIELFSLPLIFDAWLTAIVATIFNAYLLLIIRIPAERQALRLLKK